MHATHYTLAALARALHRRFDWARVAEAYTQVRDELRLVFDAPAGPTTLVVALRPPAVYPLNDAARARRNSTDVLDGLAGRRLERIHAAPLDRHLLLDFDGDVRLDLVLFGPQPNALLVQDGEVIDAFLSPARLVGTAAPTPRSALLPEHPAALGPRLFPTFDALLAAEAGHRAALGGDGADDSAALLAAARALHAEALASGDARVYWDAAGRPVAFSLVSLHHLGVEDVNALKREQSVNDLMLREERFADVSAALRVFSRRRFATAALDRRCAALAVRLDAAAHDLAARADALLDALAQPSRAAAHEAEGHLLMARLHDVSSGAASVQVVDFDGAPRTLALDPALSPVQNAHARYDRARRSRAARHSAEARLEEALAAAAAARALRTRLDEATTPEALVALAAEADALLPRAASGPGSERLPYHRVDLGGGYEAWIGRSARDNDVLTLRHARPYDLWLHARGVAGSHVVLRVKGRADVPPGAVVERAARLAAFHSKARTSALVPVVVTPRKWVRKAKGSAPGQVVVEREAEVRIVPPEAA